MGIKITDRDTEIISFLKTVKCSDAKSISTIFFNGSLRSCQKRLLMLSECGYINRFRDNRWEQYVYYIGSKPKQFKHDLYISKLIVKLKEDGTEILKIKSATKIGDIITDGIIAYKKDDKVKIVFVEIEKHFRQHTIDKYVKLYKDGSYKQYGFPTMPSLIIVCDKKVDIKNIPFDIKVVKFDNIR